MITNQTSAAAARIAIAGLLASLLVGCGSTSVPRFPDPVPCPEPDQVVLPALGQTAPDISEIAARPLQVRELWDGIAIDFMMVDSRPDSYAMSSLSMHLEGQFGSPPVVVHAEQGGVSSRIALVPRVRGTDVIHRNSTFEQRIVGLVVTNRDPAIWATSSVECQTQGNKYHIQTCLFKGKIPAGITSAFVSYDPQYDKYGSNVSPGQSNASQPPGVVVIPSGVWLPREEKQYRLYSAQVPVIRHMPSSERVASPF